MGKTLGGNAGPVTCFRGAGTLGSAAEQSFGESDQMIQIFAEKSPCLFGRITGLQFVRSVTSPARWQSRQVGWQHHRRPH